MSIANNCIISENLRSRRIGRTAAYPLFEKFDAGVRELKPEYILDGRRTTTLEAFCNEVGQVLLAGQPWDENLDGFHAVLRGDYGYLPEACRLVWREVDYAKASLGYDETVRQLLQRLRDCPPTTLIKTAWALRAALRKQGPTVFDWLVEAINHYPNIELVLVETTDDFEQPSFVSERA